jgi:superfamily II DNA helicase RecQ
MLDLIQPTSVLAITATAGPRVVKDICLSLGICEATANPEDEDAVGTRLMKTDRDNIDVSCYMFATQNERISSVSGR